MDINVEEWFDAKALISSLLSEVNVVTGHKFQAFTMPNRTVYVMVGLIEELISEQYLNAYPDDAAPLSDREARINVLIACVESLRRDYDFIDERFLKPGYFFGKFDVTYGTATKTRQYVPFTYEAFGYDLSIEDNKPTAVARIVKIEPHYENPYFGTIVPEIDLDQSGDPVKEESISWLLGHEAMFVEKLIYQVNVIEGGGSVAKFGAFSTDDGTLFISPTTAYDVAVKTADTLSRMNDRSESYAIVSTDVPKIMRQVAMKYGLMKVEKQNEGIFGCYTVEWHDGGFSYRKYPFFPLDGEVILNNFVEINSNKPERIKRIKNVELFC